MIDEKRKSKRTDIDISIQLRVIQEVKLDHNTNKEVAVHLVNISKDGIAFKSKETFIYDKLYDTEITLSNNEKFSTVIKIVRIEKSNDSEFLYGCRFVGINSFDQFKIEVFQALAEFGRI